MKEDNQYILYILVLSSYCCRIILLGYEELVNIRLLY